MTLTFGNYQARLLDARTAPSGVKIEIYALEATGDYGRPICQAELFKGPTHAQWSEWVGGNWRYRKELARLCAERNRVAK